MLERGEGRCRDRGPVREREGRDRKRRGRERAREGEIEREGERCIDRG